MALRYAIVGVGGIGGYYGGCLAKAGCDVHFLFRSDYEYVKQSGMRVESVNGNFVLPNVNAYCTSQQMPLCDVVLVSLKTTTNGSLSQILPPLLHDKSIIVLIQNGLNIEAELSAAIPGVAVAGATAFICTTKVGHGHIRHAAYGDLTMAGYCGNCSPLLQLIAADFARAGVNVHLTDDINTMRWKKLVWNIPYNGLTVVLNAATNELTFNPATRPLIIDLMREVVAAGCACNASIADSFVDNMIDLTEKMMPYSPSMKIDFDARRPMEIRTMYSNPISVAKAAGYIMAKTEVLEHQLLFLQSKNQS